MKKIILDTDIGGDCDDAGALAIICAAELKKRAKLLGITISTANPYAAGCADSIVRYYSNPVPIGQTKIRPNGEDSNFYESSYGKHITEKFENGYRPEIGKKPEDAVRLLRRLLTENIDSKEKITLVVIGCCINIAALIKSKKDDISSLDGIELIRRSVDQISLMGCYFPTKEVPEIWFGNYKMEAECNIKVDITSARIVFNDCPVPIIVSHYLIGLNIMTGNQIMLNDKNNPVAESYLVHSHGNRCSWDPVSAYYAIYGTNEFFVLSENGRVEIDENGISSFKRIKDGKHKLIECLSYERSEKALDDAMEGKV